MDYEKFYILFDYVEKIGPLAGILLPIIEAFIPVLPLVGFVIINVAAFGFFFGYLYSWLGNCIGTFLLFLVIRKIGGNRLEVRIKNSRYRGTLDKIKKKDMTVLFFLYCFPFTPSFLISGAAALANMDTQRFLITMLPSKFVMVLSLSFIGENVSSFFENPVKSILYILLILVFNLISKKAFQKYEEHHRGN
ncbi:MULTISPECIES: TVP38/TMEM64 family protein [unclassified Sedimentibacter]|uniref:TVP38/TMEM64 family protein n=1 Tax=unclassified Sedimentibacter TaxID=2649220 RepID=UPI0027E1CAE5|nr:VTT domain-containing protein [Sedimentibacter sp. MB35-C1]WMJ78961.1 VTT domain-containing protein [Sedimentibacter sp. MB35-C1]